MFVINKKNNKKVRYSMFSFRAALGIFFATSSSVLYTFFAYTRLYEKIADSPSSSDNLWLILITYVVLSLIYTLFSLVFRRLTIKNPLLRILDATEKIGVGDFSVRLPVKNNKHFLNEFDVISENVNKMTEDLSGIESLRNDFVSNVSHEFKAPLALMQNSCTILMQPELSDEDRIKYAKNISEATRRTASMITNILKLNKIESRKILAKNDRINLTELLREELLVFESEWERKSIDIELLADESIEIHSDKELLSLMWQNLLSNAFKFTPEKGKVTIVVRETEKHVYVTIADTGEGISEDKISRIFEKFYQGDTSHASQGNGLGLALVQSIAEILDYRISVDSILGEGTRFTIRINK